MKVYSALVRHRHGSNIYLAASGDALRAQVADYCREWWDEASTLNRELPEEAPGDDQEAIASYFDAQAEFGGDEYVEFFDAQEVEAA